MTTQPQRAAPDDFVSATCALPGCEADLHLMWEFAIPLYRRFLEPGQALPLPEDAYTGGWRVECEEGHVIAVPGPAGCPCGDDECEHTDFDGSDELRTFRAHDAADLRDLLGGEPS